MWTPCPHYPDPAVEILDPRFEPVAIANAGVERLFTGLRWAEGPVWFGDHRCLLVSDIPSDRILRWDAETGAVSEFRRGAFSNGATRDRQGRLVSCEHRHRRVTRTEVDGRLTVLADTYRGRRLNSPNDVVVASDGAVWFTDPTFGIQDHFEGVAAEAELPMNVYRLDPSGQLDAVLEDFPLPNGLCFSPDERTFYLVESLGGIHAFDHEGGRLTNGRLLIDARENGGPDGIRCDTEGRIWAGWGLVPDLFGARVFAQDGTAIGHVHLPERCANLCFGGPHRSRLMMAASRSVYALHVRAQGVPYA